MFYMGLEGLGGLEMETDEDENVGTRNDMSERVSFSLPGLGRNSRVCRKYRGFG